MALIDKVPGDLNLYIGGYVRHRTRLVSSTQATQPRQLTVQM
jgi:hypothetical protein